MMHSGKMSRKTKERRTVMVILLIFFLLIVGAVYLIIDSLAYNSAKVEVGINVKPQDFLRINDPKAKFVTKDGKDYTLGTLEVGDHVLYIKSGIFTHKTVLHVVDTVPPAARAVDVYGALGRELMPMDFVTDVEDGSCVTAAFETQPDFQKTGKQSVVVSLTDQGGNKTTFECVLELSPVKQELLIEIGSQNPKVEDFLVAGEKYTCNFPLDKVDMSKLGEYDIQISVDGQLYKSRLVVADTKPPVVKVKNIEWYVGVPVTPDYFVESIEDTTRVEASFVGEPEVDTQGNKSVTLQFKDEADNITTASCQMNVVLDTQPPVIVGAQDMIIYLGRGASYRKNVSVEDNCMEGLTLEVDSSQVILTELGEYPVTYIARDYSGNESSVTVTLTVQEQCYDVEAVYEKADEVLAGILKDDMDNREKVRAIYNYVRSHVGYINHSEKDSWVRAAYEGLYTGKGDCFVFASTTKVLLDRAGIKNMDIAKIPSRSSHYWNLVDIDDGHGWYHLDTTPRQTPVTIFLWTEQQLMDYSNQHYRSHNYDHELYPEVP